MLNSLSAHEVLRAIGFAIEVTGPILIILVTGHLVRRFGLIDEHFIASGNRIVYNLSLPCLLFFGTASSPLQESLDTDLVLFGCLTTVFMVTLLALLAPRLVSPEKQGVFIQGAFRGNMGIIGIALILNTYGAGLLAKSSIYLALLTIVYNFLSVWVLRSKGQALIAVFLKNPLIVAVVLGAVVSASGLEIPGLLRNTGDGLAALTLPLALLCIGGSLRWSSFRANHRAVVWASLFKLIVVPLLTSLGAIGYGFRGEDLGLLYLMMASPTAAASYVLAKQMTAHGDLAAEIVAFTTGACAVTVSIGLVFLKVGGYL